eukprot:GHVU01084038.1.p1 GENE.GHVU01084038.1~~GHVU01084038.1.p1  ORF type:complete len:136 (-),score=13.69 GHVU01084038.1:121-528(-)
MVLPAAHSFLTAVAIVVGGLVPRPILEVQADLMMGHYDGINRIMMMIESLRAAVRDPTISRGQQVSAMTHERARASRNCVPQPTILDDTATDEFTAYMSSAAFTWRPIDRRPTGGFIQGPRGTLPRTHDKEQEER